MENLWLNLKKEIANALKADITEIEEPEEYGDLAYACFSLAKKLKKDPKEIAIEFSKKLKIKLIDKVEAVGPYVNFYVDWGKFAKELLKNVNEKYGSFDERETVIMDVFQPNPFKPFHIGHIRCAVLGESIRRMLEFCGKKTIAVSYMGDVGTHVAKWLWYYTKFYKGEIPKEDVSKWAGEIYAEATRKVAEKPEYEEEVKEFNKKLDNRDSEIINTWKEIRDLCLKDFWKIKDELGVHLDDNFYESEVEEPGRKIVQQLLKEGKAKISEGAVVADLEKYGLNTFLLLKSDGTALYSTKDLGLNELKRKKYEFDKSIFVVATEQELYFKQLFKAMEIFNIPGWEKNFHVSFGLVTLKEGKMSSRFGTVILYEDLRDEMISKVKEILKDSEVKDNENIIRKVAFAAIKFPMLNIDSKKTIKFDWDQALDLEGKSGPYLQYSYVRAFNILNKAEIKDYDASLLKEDIETKLIKKIANFPDIIKQSTDQYAPNILANYLFELAQDFNSFYHSSPVLKAEENIKNARLKLVESIEIILKTGLELLGIPILEKM
ncbi:arginine--tRNA ligase [Candidatus Micrarchaeota archaeon RBG_16_36_9]|nr:MAG: arginine--tRNA ligase [Candidatus Micrarchaeota archaeon RBG_16_36_9]